MSKIGSLDDKWWPYTHDLKTEAVARVNKVPASSREAVCLVAYLALCFF